MFNEDKKTFNILNKISETLGLGTLKEYTKVEYPKQTEYKITTNIKSYIIIEYSKKIINNEKALKERKRKLSVLESLSNNGVPCILPLKFSDKYFIKYRNKYYIIYDDIAHENKTYKDLNKKVVRKLANTLAIIHKLNIKSNLPDDYKEIKFNLNYSLKKCQKVSQSLYDNFYNNYFIIEDIIKNINENIKYVNNTLCINDNSYYLTNILWQKDYMYLKDYNSIYLANPLVALAEYAYYYSCNNNEFNEEFYQIFIKSYKKKYGQLKSDYRVAVYVAPLKMVEELLTTINDINKKDKYLIEKANSLINDLKLYYDNIDRFNQLGI